MSTSVWAKKWGHKNSLTEQNIDDVFWVHYISICINPFPLSSPATGNLPGRQWSPIIPCRTAWESPLQVGLICLREFHRAHYCPFIFYALSNGTITVDCAVMYVCIQQRKSMTLSYLYTRVKFMHNERRLVIYVLATCFLLYRYIITHTFTVVPKGSRSISGELMLYV